MNGAIVREVNVHHESVEICECKVKEYDGENMRMQKYMYTRVYCLIPGPAITSSCFFSLKFSFLACTETTMCRATYQLQRNDFSKRMV